MDASIARARLMALWYNRGEGTLQGALRQYLIDASSATSGGTAIVSTSANGVSVTRAIADNLNPADELRIAEALNTLYDETVASGITDDEEIFKEMKFALEPVTRFSIDHSAWR